MQKSVDGTPESSRMWLCSKTCSRSVSYRYSQKARRGFSLISSPSRSSIARQGYNLDVPCRCWVLLLLSWRRLCQISLHRHSEYTQDCWHGSHIFGIEFRPELPCRTGYRWWSESRSAGSIMEISNNVPESERSGAKPYNWGDRTTILRIGKDLLFHIPTRSDGPRDPTQVSCQCRLDP